MNKQSSSSKVPQEQATSSTTCDKDYMVMMYDNYGGWDPEVGGLTLDEAKQERAKFLKHPDLYKREDIMIVKVIKD